MQEYVKRKKRKDRYARILLIIAIVVSCTITFFVNDVFVRASLHRYMILGFMVVYTALLVIFGYAVRAHYDNKVSWYLRMEDDIELENIVHYGIKVLLEREEKDATIKERLKMEEEVKQKILNRRKKNINGLKQTGEK